MPDLSRYGDPELQQLIEAEELRDEELEYERRHDDHDLIEFQPEHIRRRWREQEKVR